MKNNSEKRMLKIGAQLPKKKKKEHASLHEKNVVKINLRIRRAVERPCVLLNRLQFMD